MRYGWLLMMVFLSGAVSQDLFRAARIETDGRTYRAARDLDGDGDVDLVGLLQGNLTVFWNQAAAVFVPGSSQPAPGGLQGSMVIGDFDGNGNPDIVVPRISPPAGGVPVLTIFSIVGGVVDPPVDIPAPFSIAKMVVVDVNGDGMDDLLTLEFGAVPPTSYPFPFTVRWWTGSPGGLVQGAGLTINATVNNLEALDIDGDGLLDGVITVPTIGGGSDVIGFRSGPAGPQIVGQASTNVAGFNLVVADVESDGDSDLVLCSVFGCQVLRQQSVGAWIAEPFQPVPTTSLGHIGAGDWDGDGDEDLILGGGGGYGIVVNDGTGTFSPGPWNLPTIPSPVGFGVWSRSPGVLDINGDGFADFVGPADVLLGGGGSGPNLYAGGSVWPFVLQDVDQDGDLDVLELEYSGWWRNTGTGQREYPPRPGIVPPPAQGWTVELVADLDGDGWLDGIGSTTLNGAPELHTFLGRPDGTSVDVGLTFGIPIAVAMEGAVVVDYAADPNLDLIVQGGICLGNGLGGFSLPFPVGGTLLGVGDITGDGFPDQVRYDLALMSAWVDDGQTNARTFLPVANLLTWVVASALVADLDEDGADEFVIANSAAPELVIVDWVQGAPVVSVQPLVSALVNRVEVGDVDLNGFADLVIGHGGTDQRFVDVLQRFAPPIDYAIRSRWAGMANGGARLGDMDGDGDLDLVSGQDGLVLLGRPWFGPGRGSRRQYGVGTSGSGGFVPRLGAVGPFRVGELVTLRGRGFTGGASGLLVVGPAQAQLGNYPAPGLTAYVFPWDALVPITSAPVGVGVPGLGILDWTFAVPPGLAGLTLYGQMGFADAAGVSGVAITNGIELRFGN